MKVLVAVKRVIDAYAKVRVRTDGTGVETSHVKMSMNPFDEIAVEEAVRLKEKGIAEETIAVGLGDDGVQETLRTALALGIDSAHFISTQNAVLDPLAVAKLLKALVEKHAPDLVMLGKQAIDDDNNQTGQMLAALLNWPQGTFISELNLKDKRAEVVREIDGGLQTLSLALPAVVTTDLRLNEPRYAALPNIMKAKRKPLTITSPEALGVVIETQLEVLSVKEPPERKPGIKVSSMAELVDKLVNEAKVV